jgi:PhnB protein
VKLTPYLSFKGGCEEALKFYEQCGLGNIEVVNRYQGSPMQAHVSADTAAKILHSRFRGDGVYFMASDSPRPGEASFSGFSLTLEPETIAEAERLYKALSEGGAATMPLQKQFWGATFGMLTDKFGVPWMINCEAK